MVAFSDLGVSFGGQAVETAMVLFSGPERPGQLHTAVVCGPGGLVLDVGVFLASDGAVAPAEPELQGMVWAREVIAGPAETKHLASGLRMGLYRFSDGDFFSELNRLVPPAPGRKHAVKSVTSVAELDRAVGQAVEPVLLSAEVVGIQSRQRILGDTGPRRNRLSAVLPGANPVPGAVAAYCLTKVVPQLRIIDEAA